MSSWLNILETGVLNYYLYVLVFSDCSHTTETTHWDHPDMTSLLQTLCKCFHGRII